jgi:hypothetical protein
VQLAKKYFQKIEEVNELGGDLKDRIIELIGEVTPSQISFEPADDMAIIYSYNNGLTVRPENLKKIWALGLLRLEIIHSNGYETFFYLGGDETGYYRPIES